eukprot:11163666-Lingulodinium_polyedra.AAC.1
MDAKSPRFPRFPNHHHHHQHDHHHHHHHHCMQRQNPETFWLARSLAFCSPPAGSASSSHGEGGVHKDVVDAEPAGVELEEADLAPQRARGGGVGEGGRDGQRASDPRGLPARGLRVASAADAGCFRVAGGGHHSGGGANYAWAGSHGSTTAGATGRQHSCTRAAGG